MRRQRKFEHRAQGEPGSGHSDITANSGRDRDGMGAMVILRQLHAKHLCRKERRYRKERDNQLVTYLGDTDSAHGSRDDENHGTLKCQIVVCIETIEKRTLMACSAIEIGGLKPLSVLHIKWYAPPEVRKTPRRGTHKTVTRRSRRSKHQQTIEVVRRYCPNWQQNDRRQ